MVKHFFRIQSIQLQDVCQASLILFLNKLYPFIDARPQMLIQGSFREQLIKTSFLSRIEVFLCLCYAVHFGLGEDKLFKNNE